MTAPKFLLLVPGVPSPRSACSTTCAMIFLLAPFIAIADQSWTGTVDIQWTTPGNWSGNSPPGAGDMAVYSGAFSNPSDNLSTPFSILGLALSNNAAVTIGGSPLTLGVGGIDMSLASGSLTVNTPVVLNGNQNWNASGSFFTFNAAISGSGNVSITAPGKTIVLYGTNTSSGSVTLNSGSVFAHNPMVFSPGTVTVNSGARVLFTSGSGSTNGNIPTAFVLNGTGPALEVGGSQSTVFTGTVSLGSAATIKSDANSSFTMNGPLQGNNFALTITLSGNITNTINGAVTMGSGGLVVNGTAGGLSTLRLTSSGNSWTGGTTINTSGVLQLGDGASDGALPGDVTVNSGLLDFVVASSTVQNYSGAISGAGSLIKEGPGDLYITGNNTFSGSITNRAGGLWFNSTGSGSTSVARSICLLTSNLVPATIHLLGTNADIFFPSTITWFVTDYQQVLNEAGSNVIAGPINLGANIAGDAFMTANAGNMVLNGNIGLASGATNRNIVLGGVGSGIVNGAISGASLSLIKQDSGTWTLNNINNSYGSLGVGRTIVNGGTLVFNGQVYGATNALVVNGGTLGGYGAIKVPTIIQSGGTLAVGAAVGSLSIQNVLTLAGTNIMKVQKIGGVITNDLIAGITTINNGGTVIIQANGSGWVVGDTFTLYSAGTHHGTFSSIILPILGGGLGWDTSSLATSGVLRIVTAQPVFSSPVKLSDGNIQLTFSYNGGTGFGYRLWAYTNVATRPIIGAWSNLSSGTFNGVPVTYNDRSATNYRQRYYDITIP